MAAMPVSEEDAKLATQCLEFCQTLAGKSTTFSFSLTVGTSFSFSVETKGKDVLVPQRKKKTPSTLRRDARRREELLKKKLNASTVISPQSEQASAREAEVLRKAPPVLHHHPSPSASSERRQVVVVGCPPCTSWMALPVLPHLPTVPLHLHLQAAQPPHRHGLAPQTNSAWLKLIQCTVDLN